MVFEDSMEVSFQEPNRNARKAMMKEKLFDSFEDDTYAAPAPLVS